MVGVFCQQSIDDGMLAGTGTENQDAHESSLTGRFAADSACSYRGAMARAKISGDVGIPAVLSASKSLDAGIEPKDDDVLATAVRYLLQLLAEQAEGNTVEVRVPPYGAAQCIPGPRHTRGTPPNVVETDAETWIPLATGKVLWADAVATGRIHASGQRADLADYLPVFRGRTMEA